MTDQARNLKTVTEHITKLAGVHGHAQELITGASRGVGDVARNVLTTHGLICGLTNLAMVEADTARQAAGERIYTVSAELAEKLGTSAANYENTDYLAGRDISTECRT